jgi:hypothetical protein
MSWLVKAIGISIESVVLGRSKGGIVMMHK